MKTSGRHVLITGGASGIGWALAEKFLEAGSQVAICGRRRDKLEERQRHKPGLKIFAVDLAQAEAREKICKWVQSEMPRLDVLVNNAGVQQKLSLESSLDWEQIREEWAINFEAPVHLTNLLLPQLLHAPQATLMNVTSGLAFTPLANVPIYSATKAALRSFTLSLRKQLEKTPVKVIELIPPAVDTDLGGPGLHKFGVPLSEFIAAAWAGIEKDQSEITYGFSAQAHAATRAELEAIFQKMNP